MPPADELQKKREAARQAMEDEAHRTLRLEREKAVQAKRRNAVLAMESPAHRQRREERELLARRRAEADTARDRESEAALRAAEAKASAARAADAAARQAADTAHSARLDRIERGEAIAGEIATGHVEISPLRTLKSDMARAVRQEGVSLAKIALSEQAKRRLNKTPVVTPPAKKSGGLFGTLLVLVLLGAGGWFAWQWYNGQSMVVGPLQPSTPAPLVFAEESRLVPLSAQTEPGEVYTAIGGTMSQASTEVLTAFYPSANQEVLVWPALQNRLALAVPAPLARTLGQHYLLGTYGGERVVVLTTNFYERALASMRDWEPTLFGDMGRLIVGGQSEAPRAGLTWTDRVIQNKDTRQLRAADGQTVLVWAFLDREHLVIAASEQMFLELLERFIANG